MRARLCYIVLVPKTRQTLWVGFFLDMKMQKQFQVLVQVAEWHGLGHRLCLWWRYGSDRDHWGCCHPGGVGFPWPPWKPVDRRTSRPLLSTVVSEAKGYPNSWIVRENPHLKWMILGYPYMFHILSLYSLSFSRSRRGSWQPGGLSGGFTHRCMLSESFWISVAWHEHHEALILRKSTSVFFFYHFGTKIRIIIGVYRFKGYIFRWLYIFCTSICSRSGTPKHSIGSFVWRWEIRLLSDANCLAGSCDATKSEN